MRMAAPTLYPLDALPTGMYVADRRTSRPAPHARCSTSHQTDLGRDTREGGIPSIVTQGRPGVLPLTNKPDHTHTRTRTHSPPTDRAPARVLLAFRPRACLPPDSSRAALVNGPRQLRGQRRVHSVPDRRHTIPSSQRPRARAHEHAPTSTRPGARAQEHAPRSTRSTSARAGESALTGARWRGPGAYARRSAGAARASPRASPGAIDR